MEIKTDVLIIGSGIAGLYAALKISEFANVAVITKKEKSESNTNYAQGGIASVFDPNDSFEKHISDTLTAGDGLCDRKAVEVLVKEGPDKVFDLMKIGAEFTKKEDGSLDLAKEGGHSAHRIVHSKDLTGREVEMALLRAVSQKNNIQILENHFAIDLLTEHNIFQLRNEPINNRKCYGAYVLNCSTGTVITIQAKATILATGGLGQVYLHTTNPRIATGDGFAMAYRAGVVLGNMEFIQFHPTSLFTHHKANIYTPNFLISEAVRGFGGLLRNQKGERFMEKYDPRKELAPRDIVARAIDNELKKSGEDCVYLDITHKNADEIKSHFPHIYNNCLNYGIDITKNLIPVVPAAHYACGGIVVDLNGRTSLKGLYAVGEVSMTGVHGANRLASNSLLEALVFSYKAALDLKENISSLKYSDYPIPAWDESGTLSIEENIMITHSVKEIKHLMWDYVGIVRSNLRLDRAAHRMHLLYNEIEEFYKKTKVSESLLELRNIAATAHTIIKCAKLRKESRGLHYTIDYPFKLEKSENTIIQNKNP